MKQGDIILLSRPLGIGIFFAAQMRNINLFESSNFVFDNLTSSQQPLIEELISLQCKLDKKIINASTDITGFGFLGHLKEMIDATNLKNKNERNKPIKVELDLNAFKAYPGMLKIIAKGIKSSLFDENKKILDNINFQNPNERIITFKKENNLNEEDYFHKVELLIDPQTCGPICISCQPEYKKYLNNCWYEVGKVLEK